VLYEDMEDLASGVYQGVKEEV